MPFAHLSRRDALRLALLAGGGLISGGALAGCKADTSTAGGAIKPGAKIVFASTTITNSLDPHIALSNVGRSYAVQVYDALLGYDDAGAIAPALATAWKRVDELTVELTLRDGVTFHDGGAFDAETVVANIARLTDGGAEVSATKSFLGAVAKATAVDARTVRITTTTPDPVLFNRLTRIDMVDPAVFGNAGDKASGTGPFRVTGYTPGQRVELEAFAGSWRATDRVASATIQGIPDAGTMASALRAGEVDIAFGLGATQAEQLRSQFGILHPSAGSAAICSLISDVEPKLADPRVREALNLAINRDEFVNAGLAGYGKPSNGQLLQEGMLGYDPSIPRSASTPIAPGRCSRRPAPRASGSTSPPPPSSSPRPRSSPVTSTPSASKARWRSRSCRCSSAPCSAPAGRRCSTGRPTTSTCATSSPSPASARSRRRCSRTSTTSGTSSCTSRPARNWTRPGGPG